MDTPMRSPRQQQLDSVTLRAVINARAESRGLPAVELFTYGVRYDLNTNLSTACEGSVHHVCNGARVAFDGTGFWRCRCLCHHATRFDRVVLEGERRDDEVRRRAASHTLYTEHETWSAPGQGWSCVDPTCPEHRPSVIDAIERTYPDAD